ncbi:MAG: hypothetical protein MI745_04335 [Pseudomonadales bacterium]|nr:hypothetical protein [Pseudomonadales bacterium]
MMLRQGRMAAAVALILTLLLTGCGMDSEEKRVAMAINQALTTQGLGYWQVEDVDVEQQREEQAGPLHIATYDVQAELVLETPLREVRYVDERERRVVTHTGLPEGASRDLRASVQITRTGDTDSVVTTLDEGDLPRGMTRADFEHRFDGWEIIAVDSDAYQELVDARQAALDKRLTALAEADHALRQVQVQLMAAQAELAVLEKNAEEVGGLGEPMERASQEVEVLLEQVAEREAHRDALARQVEQRKQTLADLKGE